MESQWKVLVRNEMVISLLQIGKYDNCEDEKFEKD